MRRIILALPALLLAVGCSHQEQAMGRSTGSWTESAKEDFVNAYDSVKAGLSKTATAGKYALEDAGNGVVRVSDRSKEAAVTTGSKIEDGWITTKVKSAYATDPTLKSGDLHVNTDRGIVRVSGVVPGSREAQRAIEDALAIKGVTAVDADLRAPAGQGATGVYSTPDELPPR